MVGCPERTTSLKGARRGCSKRAKPLTKIGTRLRESSLVARRRSILQ